MLKHLVDTFNQEKAKVGAFSVIVKFSRTFVISCPVYPLHRGSRLSSAIIYSELSGACGES